MSQSGVWELLARAGKPMTKKELQEATHITSRSQLDDDLRGLRMRRVLKVTTAERGRNLYSLNDKGKREA